MANCAARMDKSVAPPARSSNLEFAERHGAQIACIFYFTPRVKGWACFSWAGYCGSQEQCYSNAPQHEALRGVLRRLAFAGGDYDWSKRRFLEYESDSGSQARRCGSADARRSSRAAAKSERNRGQDHGHWDQFYRCVLPGRALPGGAALCRRPGSSRHGLRSGQRREVVESWRSCGLHKHSRLVCGVRGGAGRSCGAHSGGRQRSASGRSHAAGHDRALSGAQHVPT